MFIRELGVLEGKWLCYGVFYFSFIVGDDVVVFCDREDVVVWIYKSFVV